jgi:ribosomal protein L29
MDSQEIKSKMSRIESRYLTKLIQLVIDKFGKDIGRMDYEELKAKRLDLERQILNLKVSEAHQECDERKSKYMIWRRGTLRIEYEHTTIESAMAEAERIARFNPGSEVYVLKQLGFAKVPSSDVQWTIWGRPVEKLDIKLPDDDESDDDIPMPF